MSLYIFSEVMSVFYVSFFSNSIPTLTLFDQNTMLLIVRKSLYNTMITIRFHVAIDYEY